MEIIKVQLGRAVWLFDLEELNPRGAALFPEVFAGFIKTYQFAVVPTTQEIQAGGSLYFKQGRFPYEQSSVAVDFEMHNDGLVANTRHSTEAAHAFLQDSVTWLGQQIGAIYPATLGKKRVYRSEIIVSLNADLDSLSERLRRFSKLLAAMTKESAQVTGLLFGSQQSPARLYLERKTGNNTPLSDNHYIANAWLQTAQHLELLREFENLMA